MRYRIAGNLVFRVCSFCVKIRFSHCSGRVEPVPFELKDDHMGVGRWTMEVGGAWEGWGTDHAVGVVWEGTDHGGLREVGY